MEVTKSSFDLDFSYGREGEQLVEQLLTNGKTVEVKSYADDTNYQKQIYSDQIAIVYADIRLNAKF